MLVWYTSSAMSTISSSWQNWMISFRLSYDRHCPVGLPAQSSQHLSKHHLQCHVHGKTVYALHDAP